MGQARLRRLAAVPTVYHHTSTLRTNLLWMSGVVQVEGKSEGAFHPQLGEIKTDALARRGLEDFPPVAWFTRQIDVPNCLLKASIVIEDKDTGERREFSRAQDLSNAMALNRVALGFPLADIPVVPWPEHPGYGTGEGRELNETAREAGDDPDDWYVSEVPVDLMKVSEFWHSPSMLRPKLRRVERYVPDIHRMVKMCRETQGAYIPPSWLKPEDATKLARSLGLPIANPAGDATGLPRL
jgi:hypothetical protein